jgi:hypothetical protein
VCQTENCWFFGPAEAFEPRPGPDELMDAPNPELTLNRFDAWPWDLPRGGEGAPDTC